MDARPTPEELDKIATLAHGAYGWLLERSEVYDIWRLTKGLTVLKRGYPMDTDFRHIARGWLQIRGVAL